MSVERGQGKSKTLWVCWEKPPLLPANGTVIVSLLAPGVEAELKQKYPYRFVSLRERVSEVKQQALETYIDIVARIGTVTSDNGITLREALQDKGGISAWWFHKVSWKDCESEPTFDRIIQILAIERIAQDYEVEHLVAWGSPQEIVEVLSQRFSVRAISPRRRNALFFYLFSLLRRVKFAIKFLYEFILLKGYLRGPARQGGDIDIFFSGFWDWSVKENPSSGQLEDRYFKAVPEKLQRHNVRIGWLAWFYPNYTANQPKRSYYETVKPLLKHANIVILQSFLNWREIFDSLLRFRPFFVFCRYAKETSFKKSFHAGGFDFYPLFKRLLYAGFLDRTIPYHQLICLAHKKAAGRYRPKKIVTFLNFFPYARALYAGVKKGNPDSLVYDIQHASYSWEDTIGLLDAQREFKGMPDGCPIPHADYMFVMGNLGRDIFMESGFADERILLTGSSRYDEVALIEIHPRRDQRLKKSILIIGSLNKALALEMVDAVYNAFALFPDVTLRLRSHPFCDIRSGRGFNKYKSRIHATSGTTLEEDLANTDVVIFSYSTVAEEAFIRGVPVWQWISAGYNASIFADMRMIPTFFCVEGLIRLYREFLENPYKFSPTLEQRRLIKEKCFYFDGKKLPSDHITDALISRAVGEQGVVFPQVQESRV